MKMRLFDRVYAILQDVESLDEDLNELRPEMKDVPMDSGDYHVGEAASALSNILSFIDGASDDS